jgi:hypothetical protein
MQQVHCIAFFLRLTTASAEITSKAKSPLPIPNHLHTCQLSQQLKVTGNFSAWQIREGPNEMQHVHDWALNQLVAPKT